MWLGGLNYKSLKFRTSLVIACTVSLILILESYVITQISGRVVEQQLKGRVQDAATNLYDYLNSSEARQRNELTGSIDLDIFIRNILRDQRAFIKIEVFSVSGQERKASIAREQVLEFKVDPALYEQTIREKRPIRSYQMLNERERLWIVVAPVITPEGAVIGVFSVTISLNDVDDLIRRLAKYAAFTAVLSIIFLTLVLIYYLNRSVSDPIRAIVAAMERVQGGDLNTTAQVRTGDEIGELAKNFNTMVAKLKEEDERIANFNKELQARIAEAVQELNERNQDLVELTENLFETQKQLSRLETLASMGQLAASVAHEIGTPLHSISGHVQLLLEKESLPSEVVEKLKIIQAQISRLTEIISRTLNTTRLPAPEFARVDINAVVKDIINLVQPGLRKKHIEIIAELGEPMAPVYADQNQLQQVFLNLVTNAVEAMPSGGHLRIATGVRRTNAKGLGLNSHASGVGSDNHGLVEITFEDSGMGIAPQDLRSIFKPFFSTKNSRKAAGLGLAICRAIIKDHKGDIEVCSQIGQGTQFTIQLPAMSGSPVG